MRKTPAYLLPFTDDEEEDEEDAPLSPSFPPLIYDASPSFSPTAETRREENSPIWPLGITRQREL